MKPLGSRIHLTKFYKKINTKTTLNPIGRQNDALKNIILPWSYSLFIGET